MNLGTCRWYLVCKIHQNKSIDVGRPQTINFVRHQQSGGISFRAKATILRENMYAIHVFQIVPACFIALVLYTVLFSYRILCVRMRLMCLCCDSWSFKILHGLYIYILHLCLNIQLFLFCGWSTLCHFRFQEYLPCKQF